MEKLSLLEKIESAKEYIMQKASCSPQIGIVLGTGLGGLVERIDEEKSIPYKELPSFPQSTVESHMGNLVLGAMGDKQVVMMQGRFHYMKAILWNR